MNIEPRYSEAFTWYKLRKIICKLFSDEVDDGMKVLEVGCARGINIRMLKKLLPDSMDVEFHGVDISPKAVKEACESFEKEGMKNCFFRVGKAENLKYDDMCFDIVVCTEVLEHLPDPRIALSEIYRVLKKEGCAILSTPNGANIFKKVAGRKIKERLEETDSGDPYECKDDSFGHISVLHSKELIAMVKKAGFRIEWIGKGSMLYGAPFYDRHQVLFAVILIMDFILDHLPRNYNFSWGLVLKLRKN